MALHGRSCTSLQRALHLIAIIAFHQLFDQVSAAETITETQALPLRRPKPPNIKVVAISGPSIAEEGTTVILRCEFDQAVSCWWKRNNQPISIDNEIYVLVSEAQMNKGGNTKWSNCSLRINSANQQRDAGKWRCVSAAHSNYAGTESKEIPLTVSEKTSLALPHESLGNSIKLECNKRLSGNCTWLRGNKEVTIDASQYVLLPNCVLFIANITKDDLVKWECQSKHETIQCLGEIREPTLKKSRMGEWVSVICKFDVTGDCAWKRRGQRLTLGNRYDLQASARPFESTDCSINIMSFRDIDIGSWECVHVATDMATCRQLVKFTIVPESAPSNSNFFFVFTSLATLVIVALVVVSITMVVKHRR